MTETEIQSEIDTLQAKYHEVANTAPRPVLQEITERLKELRTIQSRLIADGAVECSDCGNKAHGMHRIIPGPSRTVLKVYEIGCLTCAERRVIKPSREDAVTAWNELQHA